MFIESGCPRAAGSAPVACPCSRGGRSRLAFPWSWERHRNRRACRRASMSRVRN